MFWPSLQKSPLSSEPQGDREFKPVKAWKWITLALGLIGIVSSVITFWLWKVASDATGKTALANAHLTAIKTGLAAGGGAAALIGLLLAARKQYASEIDAITIAKGAADQRVTELYQGAAEGLGSEKATVRLASLYALERLAQDNPAHRQVCMNVLCSYLRMPYVPPGAPPAKSRILAWEQTLKDPDEAREELQVRLTAQRILASHLRPRGSDDPNGSRYWSDMVLDLSEAALVGFDMSGCIIGSSDFRGVTFHGIARFEGAQFNKPVRFSECTFNNCACFSRVDFEYPVDFSGALFMAEAEFRGVSFTQAVDFEGAEFAESASFSQATIRRVDGKVQKHFPCGWQARRRNGDYRLVRGPSGVATSSSDSAAAS
jgi:hypothetical protein